MQEFANPCLRDHLELALRLDHAAVKRYLSGSVEEAECGSIAAATPADFYSLLLQASGDAQLRDNLLDFACRNRSIELTVIAAALDPAESFRCLCAYIYFNLPEGSRPEELPEWNSETLTHLLHSAMSNALPELPVEAFRIFLPDHLLALLLDWLVAFSHGVADKTALEALRSAVSNYKAEPPEFFRDVAEAARMALQLLSWWLTFIIQDVDKQMELVALWADVLPFEPGAGDESR